MNCIIIGGFLGSGKTTFINYLLKYSEELFPGMKTALLINEFGEIPVDAAIMDAGSYSMREITGGCICCTLKGLLADAVSEIKEREKPDLLIVEATGLAVPSEIASSVGAAGGAAVFTQLCVDPDQYSKLAGKLAVYDRQLACADVVMLTKKDLRNGSQLEEVRAELADSRPGPCFDERDDMLGYLFSELAGFKRPAEAEAHPHVHAVHHEKHETKLEIAQVTRRLSGFTDLTALEDSLRRTAADAGRDLYRIKGIVRTTDGWKAVQFADGQMSVRTVEPSDNGESFVVFIGKSGAVEEIRL